MSRLINFCFAQSNLGTRLIKIIVEFLKSLNEGSVSNMYSFSGLSIFSSSFFVIQIILETSSEMNNLSLDVFCSKDNNDFILSESESITTEERLQIYVIKF